VDRLVVPEQRQQKDDRQRNADQPEQQAFTEGHDSLLKVEGFSG
jgi:hypothetical protein